VSLFIAFFKQDSDLSELLHELLGNLPIIENGRIWARKRLEDSLRGVPDCFEGAKRVLVLFFGSGGKH
jgi:hypothetical protein